MENMKIANDSTIEGVDVFCDLRTSIDPELSDDGHNLARCAGSYPGFLPARKGGKMPTV